jgi:hypothetical protein
VVAALAMLFHHSWRRLIFASGREASAGVGALMVGSKIVAGFGSLFVSLALALGNASLTNALQGTEYVFLLVLTYFFSKKYPEILHEKSSPLIIAQKIIAVLLIAGGLAILAF